MLVVTGPDREMPEQGMPDLRSGPDVVPWNVLAGGFLADWQHCCQELML